MIPIQQMFELWDTLDLGKLEIVADKAIVLCGWTNRIVLTVRLHRHNLEYFEHDKVLSDSFKTFRIDMPRNMRADSLADQVLVDQIEANQTIWVIKDNGKFVLQIWSDDEIDSGNKESRPSSDRQMIRGVSGKNSKWYYRITGRWS